MNRHRPGARPPQRRQSDRTRTTQEITYVEQLWPEYLKGGYFDDEGNLRVEYVSREKVEPLVRAMANAHPELTHGQLRRFFQHCRRIEARLKTGEEDWGRVRPQVAFLDSAAQDAYGKQPRKIPALFRDFIERNVAVIDSENDLRNGFLPHFEALVGFGSTHIKRDRN